MAKRGRKKGSKNKFKGIPENFYYWRITVGQEVINDFLERGSEYQKELIKHTLDYLKANEPEYFEEVNGEEILRRLK